MPELDPILPHPAAQERRRAAALSREVDQPGVGILHLDAVFGELAEDLGQLLGRRPEVGAHLAYLGLLEVAAVRPDRDDEPPPPALEVTAASAGLDHPLGLGTELAVEQRLGLL